MRHNFIGMVVSTAAQKTVKVRVPKRVMNHHVHKELLMHKNYLVHDELDQCKLGDVVRIEHCRKVSKRKTFAVAEIVKPARTWTDPETGIVVSRVAVRGFSVSAASKKDFLQDLYLKEIRGYKADPKASKADVTTKVFVAPKAAQAPKSDIDLDADIKSYEKNGVISQ
ncbi:hypothetical protein GGH94_003611 [Coemansia aciculifera]|uniref:Nucleic acid-binding protein n=1 Tax=Coemansia aciculifera TaxID=417176 RepID=A0A9W8IQU3_9FUNG|nr:hypothetical protein GGH94_003611 [Coemansia aciculifera]